MLYIGVETFSKKKKKNTNILTPIISDKKQINTILLKLTTDSSLNLPNYHCDKSQSTSQALDLAAYH